MSVGVFLSAENERANIQIESTGSIVLQVRFFSEVIRKLLGETFTLEVLESKQVVVTSGKANSIMDRLDMDSYPHLPVVKGHNQMKLPIHVLAKLINKTIFTASQHKNRPVLTDVHSTLSDHSLSAVATDPHRPNQRVIPVEQTTDHPGIVIPKKGLIELSRSLTNEEKIVRINVMENQVLLKTEAMYFYFRLLEGSYPDTDCLIPLGLNIGVELSVPSFPAVIECASLFSHEGRDNIVHLSIRPDTAVLYGNSPEVGEVEESLSYTASNGGPLEISFNPDYMKTALRASGDMSIKVRFISAIRPFTSEPTEDDVQFI